MYSAYVKVLLVFFSRQSSGPVLVSLIQRKQTNSTYFSIKCSTLFTTFDLSILTSSYLAMFLSSHKNQKPRRGRTKYRLPGALGFALMGQRQNMSLGRSSFFGEKYLGLGLGKYLGEKAALTFRCKTDFHFLLNYLICQEPIFPQSPQRSKFRG